MDNDPFIGQQLGAYTIQSKLGEGGMARVYKGYHARLRREVAIKVILSQIADKEGFKARFEREAQLIASLQHPNIVAVYDFGEIDNLTYLVMQYVGGGTLRNQLRGGYALGPRQAILYCQQMARALHHAHLRGIVHRDVKPQNMLVSATDRTQLLLSDFGIAKLYNNRNEGTMIGVTGGELRNDTSLTSVDQIVGTADYMSPEQINGKPVDARTDVYGLGAVLFQMLAGEAPFHSTTIQGLLFEHVYTIPRPVRELNPYVPEILGQITAKALAKAPEDRFQSAEAMAQALETAISELPFNSRDFSPGEGYISRPQTFNAKTFPSQHLEAAFIGNKCPNCGTEVQLEESFCPNCGYHLSPEISSKEQTFFTIGQSSAEALPPSISISNMPTISINLPSASKEESESIQALPIEKCPNCGNEAQPENNSCPKCGYSLVPVAPVTDQEQLGTIGTSFMPTFGVQYGTIGGHTDLESDPSLLIAPPKEQTPPDEPKIIVQDSAILPHPLQPSNSTIAIKQTIDQLLAEGEIHYQAKRYEDALIVYDHVVQLDPRNAFAHGSRGNVLGRLGQYKHSLAAYELALDIDSEHSSIWNAKGDVLFKLRRYEKALVAYDTALRLNPDNVRTWIAKGNVLFKLRRFEDALDAYNNSITINTSYPVIWSKGKVLFELGRYEEALDAYEQALKYSPKKATMWDEKGEVLYKLKRYHEALDDHNRALALDPYNVTISRKCDRLRDLIIHLGKRATQAQIAQQPSDDKVLDHEDQIAGHLDRIQASHDFQSKSEKSKQPKVEAESKTHVEYFDVFISYSEADMAWVENLAKHLEDEYKFRVWLDKWVLIPGQSWQQAKARGLDQAKCCVVCIGEHTPQGWTEQEIQRAKNRQAKDPSFGVIPVLLPTAKNINIDNFLELNAPVDFRNADAAYALHLLVCGVKGESPGRWSTNETTNTRTITLVQDMLEDLERLRQTNLITDHIKEEYMRITMEKVWLAGWTLAVKDSTDE